VIGNFEPDFPAAAEFIRRARAEAADGGRPPDLSGFGED
jgi:hypothetical protein